MVVAHFLFQTSIRVDSSYWSHRLQWNKQRDKWNYQDSNLLLWKFPIKFCREETSPSNKTTPFILEVRVLSCEFLFGATGPLERLLFLLHLFVSPFVRFYFLKFIIQSPQLPWVLGSAHVPAILSFDYNSSI